MTFGARLAAARTRKQLTQAGLGKGLGTDGKDASKAVVYGWEKNQHHPRADQLVLICDKLKVSADHLLFGKETSDQLSPDVAAVVRQLETLPKDARDNLVSLFNKMVQAEKNALAQMDESASTTTQDLSHVGLRKAQS